MKGPRNADQRRTPEPLRDDDLRHVVGGARKAGEGQKDFLTLTMKDALISSF